MFKLFTPKTFVPWYNYFCILDAGICLSIQSKELSCKCNLSEHAAKLCYPGCRELIYCELSVASVNNITSLQGNGGSKSEIIFLMPLKDAFLAPLIIVAAIKGRYDPWKPCSLSAKKYSFLLIMLQQKCLHSPKSSSGILILLVLAVHLLVLYKMTCNPLKEKSLRISWVQLFKEGLVPTTRSLDTSYTESKTACFLLGKESPPSVWLIACKMTLLIPLIRIFHCCNSHIQMQWSGAFHPAADWQVAWHGDGGECERLPTSPQMGGLITACLLIQ